MILTHHHVHEKLARESVLEIVLEPGKMDDGTDFPIEAEMKS